MRHEALEGSSHDGGIAQFTGHEVKGVSQNTEFIGRLYRYYDIEIAMRHFQKAILQSHDRTTHA